MQPVARAAAAAVSLLGWLAVLGWVPAAVGCGGAPTPEVVRRIEGRRTPGPAISPYAYEHFIRGELAFAREDWPAAIEALRQARAGPDEDPLVLARLAEALDRLDREDEARAVLSTGDARFPGHPELALARGRIAERRGRLDEAIAAFGRAAEGRDVDGHAVLALARSLEAAGRAGRAEAVLAARARGLRGDGTAPAAARRSPYGAATASGRVAAVRVDRARLALALRRGDADAAAAAVDRWLQVAPVGAAEVEAAAETALAAGRPELARRLLEHLPLGRSELNLRLEVLVQAGRLDEAEALLTHPALDLAPDDPRRAAWALRVGRPDLAVEVLDLYELRRRNGRGGEEGPRRAGEAVGPGGGAPGPVGRLRLRALLAMGAPEASPVPLAGAAPSAGDFVASRLALAQALRLDGRPGLAAETLAEARTRRPDAPALAAALARCLEIAGAWEAGLALWASLSPEAADPPARGRPGDGGGSNAPSTPDRAAAAAAVVVVPEHGHDPDDDGGGLDADQIRRARAARLHRTGHHRAAARALTRHLALAPDDLVAWVRLAEAQRAAGELEAARETAVRVLPWAYTATLAERLEELAATTTAPSDPAGR